MDALTRDYSRRDLLRLGAGVGSGLLLGACGNLKTDSPAKSTYPDHAVEWVVPFAPGGSTDLIARTLAKGLEKPLGQSVVVVNREGAAAVVGTKEVLGAQPDGYKIAFPPSSLFTITPLVVKNAQEVKLEEMKIVTGLTVENIVIIVHKDSPYKTIQDLLQEKGTGKKLKFAHSGVGTGVYFSQLAFYKEAGIDAIDVPFGGSGPAVTALLGKQVDVAASQVAESNKYVVSGDMRRLAIFSAERSQLLPNLPTIKEAGFDLVVDQSRFVAGPAKMPDNVVSVLAKAFQEATRSTEYGQFLADNFIERRQFSGEELTKRIKSDLERYKVLAEKFGIQPK